MNGEFIAEPELEFGGGGRHIDIRFGIMDYGPADAGLDRAPSQIVVGMIGTPGSIEGARLWLERCRQEIHAKASRQPNLFPRFPGFQPDEAFRSTLVLDSDLERQIPAREIERLVRGDDHNRVVTEAADRFCAEMRLLKEKRPPHVFVCAVPPEIDLLRNPEARAGAAQAGAGEIHDFRRLLKAKAMDLGIPTQLITAPTYDRSQRRGQKSRPDRPRLLQDEATSAWNIHSALYYKAGGLPWRLVRDPAEYRTCYIGVSFFYGLDRSNVMTSMAQIFDERGDGIVVRGAPVRVSREDRVPHLEEAAAHSLLAQALRRYREEHGAPPARVVLHKTSSFDAAEREGFSGAADDERIDNLDFLSITERHAPRLFRSGAYPPLRGTLLSLSGKEHVLYTRGSVDFFRTYPGMYVPRPLHFRCDETMSTPRALAREILALTKMNWNKTQFDESEPITVSAARRVGDILKYVDVGRTIESRYSYYM
jgi:hypothetical protein